MGMTVAPLNAWFVAWIALSPLWVIAIAPPRQLALKADLRQRILPGLLWGIGYHGLVASWIVGLHPLTWMGIPWLASLLIVLMCWLALTLWGTTFVILWILGMQILKRWTGTSLRSRLDWGLRILVGTTLWCGMEWLRSLSPLDWTSLAFTQSPHNLPILHLSQLSGPLTITAAIVAVNAAIAEIWSQRQSQQPASLSLRSQSLYWGIMICVVIGLHSLGWFLWSRPLLDLPSMALKIGIIQGNIPTRIKLFPAGVQQAITRYTQGYNALAKQGTHVVLTPEAALPLRWQEGSPTQDARYQPLLQAVIKQGVSLGLGTFVQDGRDRNDADRAMRTTQSLLIFNAQAQQVSRYNKVKLVPLGEYIPGEAWVGTFLRRLSPLPGSLSPGKWSQTVQTPFGQIAIGICYDSTFSDLIRTQVAAGAQLIFTASNLDPYSVTMMQQLHAQEVMRAIESDRWLVRATNTGLSGVVDPHGQTQWLSSPNTYAIHTVTLYKRQTQTLYVRWGNWLTPILVGFSCLGITRRQLTVHH
jgi:apolipoprotein N-acyltransferase